MSKATFTNEQLCIAWAKQAKAEPQGNRGDVVRDLLGQMGEEDNDENFRKTYNNVTQRKKQLEGHATKPLVFPTLAAGKKGARRTAADQEALQNLMG
ncbi:MAG: hypothetical protein ACYS7Y_34960 [Planctomycetota bacterium]|jgi:hypothetical protein